MGRPLFAALVAVTAIGVACSSFESAPSASDVAEAGAPDAQGDPPDAATPDDVDAARRFCSDIDAQFCWSFDEGADPLRGRSFALDTPAPVLTDAALSPPFAMEARLYPDSGGVNSIAYIDTIQDVKRIVCEMDALVTNVPTGSKSGADLMRAAVFVLPRIQAQRDTTGALSLDMSGPFFSPNVPLGNLDPDTWVHLRLDVATVDGGITGTAQRDNGNPVMITKPDDAGSLGRLAHVGFGAASFENGWTVRVDNVVCRWQ